MKQEVIIYDYVDEVETLQKMYQRRLKGYKSIGYIEACEFLDENEVYGQDDYLNEFD